MMIALPILCLTLSLHLCLCFSVRPRCNSMFPHIRENWHSGSEKVRNGERQSCHSGLSICLFSIGVRPVWWEKSKVCHMLSLKTMHNDSNSEAISPKKISSHSFLIMFAQYHAYAAFRRGTFSKLFFLKITMNYFSSLCAAFSVTLHFHVLEGRLFSLGLCDLL